MTDGNTGKEQPRSARAPSNSLSPTKVGELAEMFAGDAEMPVVLTNLADMLQWARNWDRLQQSDVERARFASENFRARPGTPDLMIISGPISRKLAPRLRQLWEQMPEPNWVISTSQEANSGGDYYDSYSIVQGADMVVPVDVYIPTTSLRPEALIEGLFKLRDKLVNEGVKIPGAQ
jgi:NADH-quinone oxidoreductase subunit B